MKLTLHQIARLVDGQLHGYPEVAVTGANIIRDAEPGDITLAESPQSAVELGDCRASAVLVAPGVVPEGLPYVTVKNVHKAFSNVVKHFRPPRVQRTSGVSPAAHVSPSAKIGPRCIVHAGASIGDDVEIAAGCEIHSGVCLLAGCKIGEKTVIYPNAVLYEDTVVGERVIIHAAAVIGAFGFGYDSSPGHHVLSSQLGNVIIGDDVEVGAGTTIDRGTYGPTSIGEGTKIDNQVMIAHNCRIGRHNMICSQVGIAGSCTTGDYVAMAGQVGLRDHISIGDQAMLGAKSGIMHDIPSGTAYVGYPATPEREQMVRQAAWAKLPEMRKEFRVLQKQVEMLIERTGSRKQDAA